ncbi:MAG: ATP-binding protein [Dehalococcoidales bacterium]|nr:ATP-binding protein [Dehalococcoidales bacterium]
MNPVGRLERIGLKLQPPESAVGYLIGLLGVAVVTAAIGLVGARLHLASISMVYLIAVLATAAGWGAGPAISTSISSFLAFDWFFVEPVHTLSIAQPDEWLALVLFLLASLITGELAAALREEAAGAKRRQEDATTLYEFSLALSREIELRSLLLAASQGIVRTFGVKGCGILLADAADRSGDWVHAGEVVNVGSDEVALAQWVLEHGSSAVLARSLSNRRPTQIVRLARGGLGQIRRDRPILYYPIRTPEKVVGVLRLIGAPQVSEGRGRVTDRLLLAFCEHVAVAIDRARLQGESERAHILVESDKLKTALLSSVSHDLRTPLTAIKASATSLAQEGVWQDAAARQDLVGAIVDEADRLNKLVGNVLDMSRIESGALHPRKEWHSMAEIVYGVIDGMAQAAARHRLSVNLPDDLPFVPVDYVQIQQVIANLIDNAIKHSSADGDIAITVWVDGTQMFTSVEDTGPGIPPADLERIFDKFYTTHRAGSKGFAGVGLGLAICKGIVAAHGGDIWARNGSAGGACTTFKLPLTDPALPTPIRDNSIEPQPEDINDRKTKG